MATAAFNDAHFILILIFSILENADLFCYKLTDNMRSYSGIEQPSATTVSDCTTLCSDDQACQGITWHRQLGCYIVAQMENRQATDDAILFEHFTNCSTPAQADMTLCKFHRGIGTSVLLNGIETPRDCFTVCRIVQNCIACNWELSLYECYLFYQTPTGIANDANYGFYTKQSSCVFETTTAEISTSDETSSVTDSTTMGFTSTEAVLNGTTTTLENATIEVTTADNSYTTWSDKEGYFIYENGNKENSLEIKKSRIYCAVQCVTDIQCNGFDYNSTDLSCHLKTDDFHYRRIQ